MRSAALLGMASIVLSAAPAAGQDPRPPVPGEPAQAEATRIVRDVFREEYARQDAGSRRALAAKLLAQAEETRDDPAARYVLLREAMEVATQACDVTTSLRAIQRLGQAFEIDPIPLKKSSFEKMKRGTTTPEESAALAEAYLELAEQSARRDDLELAAACAREAEPLAAKARNLALATRARTVARQMVEMRQGLAKAEEARRKLAADPGDPGANLEAGMDLCFRREDWAGGLPLLAKGSDPALRALGAKDLSSPQEPGEQVRLGDEWWDRAESEAEPRKAHIRARARRWYEKALPSLSGLTRVKVEKRLGVSPPAPAEVPAVEEGLVAWWRFDEASGRVAKDAAGDGQQLQLSPGVLRVEGRVGGAVRFNGVDSYAVGEVSRVPAANAAQSIAWFFRFSAPPKGTHTMITLCNEPPDSAVQAGIRELRLTIWQFGGAPLVTAALADETAWHHAAYTFDGRTHRLYVDGELKATSVAPPQKALPKRAEFGRWGGGGGTGAGGYFQGSLDEVRVYSRVLSESEIKTLSTSK